MPIQFIADIGNILIRPDAPTLSVSNVSSTTAIITLYSHSNPSHNSTRKTSNDLNRIRYRQIGGDDEEKCVDMAVGTNRQLLSGLTPNAQYSVEGASQSMDTAGTIWSEYSKSITFSTMPECGVVVVLEYWIRRYISVLSDYHRTVTVSVTHNYLVDIVMEYSFDWKLEWDQKTKHRQLVLSDDGRRFSVKSGGWDAWDASEPRSMRSEVPVCASLVSFVRWEVTLLSKGKKLSFSMGYGDAEKGFDRTANIGDREHEVALAVRDGGKPVIWNDADGICLSPQRMHIKVGDRIRLDFDFRKMQCISFYNGKRLGLLHESQKRSFPKKMYFAASLFNKGSSFETTLFYAL